MALTIPLYALQVTSDEHLRRRIAFEEITCTIRKDHRDYRKGGRLMLCCEKVPWVVMADIVEVVHAYRLGSVQRPHYNAAGFATPEELEAGLRSYYPDITLTTPVTVIRWANARGAIVDALD